MFTRNRKFLHLHHNCVALELVTSLWLEKLKSSNSAKIPLDIFLFLGKFKIIQNVFWF